ncbi:OmpP1/FadL family transporter [Aquabacterium sp. A08]|uniref:OmpP1/FadL family transporter n=1 Tax=Aquabacterium sp. A08 TaxID=2718532 RepID=UPI00141DFC3E|nr:outer membrane protein transport protein [Aquabacterium sp. A08]NIC41395.1 long-chain fatty acid transporter [Aquabacterium sp. A08]NIC41442.1 long-chain fatty acid transporter [Aquabacterium sp. A08]
MGKRISWTHAAVAAAVLAGGGAAHATNGYMPHGFGIKAKGMGGASTALAHDGFAGVNNPASSAFAGNRWEIGGEIFQPKRSAGFDGLTPQVQSGREAFLIPEFGSNVVLSDKLSLGLTVYGNGGMNTSYAPFPDNSNLFGGTGKLGVDLMQLIIAPTVAYKVADGHALGVSPLLVYQRFKAYGLDGMGLPNQGNDHSRGLGVRVGYFGKLSDRVSVGASYSPKISMSKFDKYANLFAEQGDFDIPENYSMGVALQVTPTVQVALDYQGIQYSKVRSIGNPSNSMGAPGSADAPGFGWQDINVVKLGVQWQMSPQWTLRAGYNDGDNPIRPQDVQLNILAPGVIEKHLTLGATYRPNNQEELSFAVWHGKNNAVNGPAYLGLDGENNPVFGSATIRMKQNGFGFQYARKF